MYIYINHIYIYIYNPIESPRNHHGTDAPGGTPVPGPQTRPSANALRPKPGGVWCGASQMLSGLQAINH